MYFNLIKSFSNIATYISTTIFYYIVFIKLCCILSTILYCVVCIIHSASLKAVPSVQLHWGPGAWGHQNDGINYVLLRFGQYFWYLSFYLLKKITKICEIFWIWSLFGAEKVLKEGLDWVLFSLRPALIIHTYYNYFFHGSI